MFVSRTRPGERRLDPQYYAPDVLEDIAKLTSFERMRLDDLRRSSAPIVYGVLKPDGRGNRCRVVKAENFRGAFVSIQDCEPISDEMFATFKRAEVKTGDVVIAIGGHVGRPATVQGHRDGVVAAVNRHLARIRIDPNKADPHYVLSFLACGVGERLLRREVSGSVQAGINLEDLRLVEAPMPDKHAQHYIGSKVRQAEGLREWARAAEASFRGAVGLDVPDASGRGRHSRVASSDLDADLNAGRFTPDRLEVRRALQRVGARRVEDFAIIATDNDANPSPRSRYLGLDGISSNSIDLALQRFDQAGVSGTCRVLPRGAAISKLRPYLNKAAFVPGGVGHVVGSTELLCVRSDDVHPAFVYGVLKLDTTLRQLNPVASGATHPRVGPDEVLDLLVPWHDDHERLGETLERAQRAYFGARALVGAARLLVEALIERKVTEAELIAAGKDPTADRALLSRLRDDGLDGEGEPLFTDLDALDALLAEATRNR